MPGKSTPFVCNTRDVNICSIVLFQSPIDLEKWLNTSHLFSSFPILYFHFRSMSKSNTRYSSVIVGILTTVVSVHLTLRVCQNWERCRLLPLKISLTLKIPHPLHTKLPSAHFRKGNEGQGYMYTRTFCTCTHAWCLSDLYDHASMHDTYKVCWVDLKYYAVHIHYTIIHMHNVQ